MLPQKESIRKSGLRITPARLTVLKILQDFSKPLDIASIFKEVSKSHPEVDQATIYRVIENFLSKKLITKIQFQEKKFFYEIKKTDHHHVICEKCGIVEDIQRCSMKRAEQKIEDKVGFKVKSHSLEFFGICVNCQV